MVAAGRALRHNAPPAMHRSFPLLCALVAGCAGAPAPTPLPAPAGDFHRPITTASQEAQRLFDQGLLLCYGFDGEAALRLFTAAAAADPQCAMAYWGMALALGPDVDRPGLDAAASKAAFDAITRARQLVGGGSRVEFDLVEALSARYAFPPAADRHRLDRAYAEALRIAAAAHPRDDDVGTLLAAALLQLRPRQLWQAQGQPYAETAELLAALQAVLQRRPEHPGALHYSILALARSPAPQLGVAAADALRGRVRGCGRLLYAPAEIYLRVGRYADAIACCQQAIAADEARIATAGSGGRQAVERAHHQQMLMAAAMAGGQSQLALQAARDAGAQLPPELTAAQPQQLEAVHSLPLLALLRFGRWQEVLLEPLPPTGHKLGLALWHWARAMAQCSLRDLDRAAREQQAFAAAAAAVPGTWTFGDNAVADLLAVAQLQLAGELEYRRGQPEQAFALLRQAVQRADALQFDLPDPWPLPPRHALGALLLEQGRVDEALAVYRQDLEHHADEGWALHGLRECLQRNGESEAAAAVAAQFEAAWRRADVQLPGSSFCRLGVQPAAAGR